MDDILPAGPCIHVGWALWMNWWTWWCGACGVTVHEPAYINNIDGHKPGDTWGI